MVAPNRSRSSVSPRRVEANRRNALKSTGPKTPEGKAKCARNALKHGLTAALGLLPGEDPAEFEQFQADMLEELEPVGSLQEAFARQVVWAAWRLRRVPQAESAVMRRQERERVAAWEQRQAKRAKYGQMLAPSLGLGADEPPPKRRSAAQVLADRFTDAKHDPLGRVETHAVRLQRSFLWSLRALQQLQKRGREAVDERPAVESGTPAGGPATAFVDDRRCSADPDGATDWDGEVGVNGVEPEVRHDHAGTDPSADAAAHEEPRADAQRVASRQSGDAHGAQAPVQNEANAETGDVVYLAAGARVREDLSANGGAKSGQRLSHEPRPSGSGSSPSGEIAP